MIKSGKNLLYLVVAVLLFGLSATAGATDGQVLGQRLQLPNGLIWLFSPQSDLPLVTVDLTVKAGALFDPAQKEGLANLTAALLRSAPRPEMPNRLPKKLIF